MDIAVLLRESHEIDNEQWRKLSRQFFAEYRDVIMRYYGYEIQLNYTPPREIKYPRLFVAIMAVLLESRIFECNPTELSETLYCMFRFKQKPATIRRWLYEIPTEYEGFLTSFRNLFPSLKREK